MNTIVAVIHGKAGAYGVSFPDFPGLASGGETIEEALRKSKDGLDLHIEAMQEDGEDMPRLRSVEEITADPAEAEYLADMVAFALVDYDLPGKPTRLSVSMDERLVEKVDRAAKQRGLTRSGFLSQAARNALREPA